MAPFSNPTLAKKIWHAHSHLRRATINSNFLKLKAGCLFPEIEPRVKAQPASNPEKAAGIIIRRGFGDVARPLPAVVREDMLAALDKQVSRTISSGYGLEQGYELIRQAIVDVQFAFMGISADEVFICDGSKCETGKHFPCPKVMP